MKIDLENHTASFNIHVTGDTTNETYLGTFECKTLLSPLEYINANKTYRDLLGENHPENADETTLHLVTALSQLKYRLIKYPPFWENSYLPGSHILDFNVIMEVFDKAIEAEIKYKEQLSKESKDLEEELVEKIESGEIDKKEEEEEGIIEENQELANDMLS